MSRPAPFAQPNQVRQIRERLEQRRGWAEVSDRQANIDSLPDVSDKMTRGLDEEPETAEDENTEMPMGSSSATVERPAVPGFNPQGGFSSGGGTELS